MILYVNYQIRVKYIEKIIIISLEEDFYINYIILGIIIIYYKVIFFIIISFI
jgi:hypothetical protein